MLIKSFLLIKGNKQTYLSSLFPRIKFLFPFIKDIYIYMYVRHPFREKEIHKVYVAQGSTLLNAPENK